MSKASNLRREIGDVGFEFSVRCWRDGDVWIAPRVGSQARCDVLKERLTALGYAPVMNGKPHTAGEWVIEI